MACIFMPLQCPIGLHSVAAMVLWSIPLILSDRPSCYIFMYVGGSPGISNSNCCRFKLDVVFLTYVFYDGRGIGKNLVGGMSLSFSLRSLAIQYISAAYSIADSTPLCLMLYLILIGLNPFWIVPVWSGLNLFSIYFSFDSIYS